MSSTFDIDDIEFSHPKSNGLGGQHLFLNKNNEQKFRLQTPKCGVPFGLNEYNGKFTIDLQLKGGEVEEFKNEIKSLDELILTKAKKNSFQWFKKSLHESVVQELYKPQLRQNGDYPPLMKIKIPFKKSLFDGEIYNEKCEKVSIDYITKGCQIQAIVENTGVFFTSGSFGTGWKAVQLKVFPSQKLTGYAFIEE